MAFRVKPDFSAVWASLGDNTKPVDSYITNGWESVKPPRQFFNWLDNRQDSAIAYLYQAGISEWDALVDYEGGAGNASYVQGSNGKVYKCLADNGPNISGTGTKDPVNPANTAFWVEAFGSKADLDAVIASIAALGADYDTGAGIANPASFRTNLSVYSKSEVDALVTFTDVTLATEGHQVLPNGLVEKWGTYPGTASDGTITFSVGPAFSALYNVQVTPIYNQNIAAGSNTTAPVTTQVKSASTTGFTFASGRGDGGHVGPGGNGNVASAYAAQFYWRALGTA